MEWVASNTPTLHAPFFIPESAKLKLREFVLTPEQTRAVCETSARGLMP